MATATYVQDGEAIDYTPASAVAAGDVVVQGDLIGVAKTPIAANALGALAVKLIAYAIGKVIPVNTMNKIQEWLKGKKSYLTAAIGVLGAVAAWAEGQISGTALIAAVWAAAQTCFIRAGIATEVSKAQA